MDVEQMAIDDMEDFLDYWRALNPADSLDMYEAMTIYFNQETYRG